MISELANLSAGSVQQTRVSSALDTGSSEESFRLVVDQDVGELARSDFASQIEQMPRQLREPPALRDALISAGIDACPALAESYALSQDVDEPQQPVAVEPPLDWSDTVFAAEDVKVRQTLERGLFDSAFAYAWAERKDVLGRLPSASVVDALRQRGAPDWIAKELTLMALKGAPLAPDDSFSRTLHRSHPMRNEIASLVRILNEELPTRITHVILVPWMDSGGAEQVALWHARAIDDFGGRCLMIGTDAPKHAWVGRLPASTQYICLPQLLDAATLSGRLSADDCAAALGAVLSRTPFRTLHVITSYVGARMLRLPIDWGARKVYFSLFGIGRDKHGFEAGYWFEAANLQRVVRFLTDNRTLPTERARAFGLDSERIYPIAYPVEPTLRHVIRRGAGTVRRVLWASRLDREKQPALVFEIARLMPEVEFHMFGRAVIGDVQLPPPPPNVLLRGGFDGWTSIPAEHFHCFLFTSLWEGMPNIVLEAMGSGLPVIASRVGALEEVIDATRGWLVDDNGAPEPFVRALEEALVSSKEAGRRARSALLEVTRTRTFSRLMRTLDEVGYL